MYAIERSGCNHKEDEEPCGGGTATCTEKAVCATCAKPYGADPAHSWANATCTLPKTCSACGEEDGSSLGHDLSGWNRDEQSHWKTCNRNCGLTTDLGVHRDDDRDGSCDACAKVMSAATPTDPVTPTAPSEPAAVTTPGTGDVPMLPWILLLCVSAAGMLFAWKRLRKASVSK